MTCCNGLAEETIESVVDGVSFASVGLLLMLNVFSSLNTGALCGQPVANYNRTAFEQWEFGYQTMACQMGANPAWSVAGLTTIAMSLCLLVHEYHDVKEDFRSILTSQRGIQRFFFILVFVPYAVSSSIAIGQVRDLPKTAAWRDAFVGALMLMAGLLNGRFFAVLYSPLLTSIWDDGFWAAERFLAPSWLEERARENRHSVRRLDEPLLEEGGSNNRQQCSAAAVIFFLGIWGFTSTSQLVVTSSVGFSGWRFWLNQGLQWWCNAPEAAWHTSHWLVFLSNRLYGGSVSSESRVSSIWSILMVLGFAVAHALPALQSVKIAYSMPNLYFKIMTPIAAAFELLAAIPDSLMHVMNPGQDHGAGSESGFEDHSNPSHYERGAAHAI